MRLLKYGVLVTGLAALSACDQGTPETVPVVDPINTAYMDSTVNPGEDFFRYVNGSWVDQTEIPDDQVRWGSFNELAENTRETLLNVLNEAPEMPEGSDEAKAIAFYQTGMDSMAVEEAGIAPIKGMLDKIDGISDREELQSVLQDIHKYGSGEIFRFSGMADLKNSTVNAAYLWQGGLGLPDKDYYLRPDDKSVELRKGYVAHIAAMLTLAGQENAGEKAAAILALETEMATASMDRAARRNTDTLYNKYAVSDLPQLTGAFDWNQYFSSLNVSIDTVIVGMPVFYEKIGELWSSTDLATWKAYLTWHWVNAYANYLPNAFVAEHFDFFSKQLRGQEVMQPRWKRVLSNTNRLMGEPLGKLYVQKVFPPEAKAAAKEMVDNILIAFDNRLTNLEWMGDETRKMAKAKLSSFTVKIGYPDKWRDYSDYDVSADKAFATNFGNAVLASYEQSLSEIGEPVDKSRWGMSPQTVNAYYNPSNNEIVFPAAILQPPFYDYQADAAVNYGGIGAVIGHEISHGFDDQGSRFDAEGNLKNWWQESDKEEFKKRTQIIVDQYGSYTPVDSMYVNGNLTLGENIADLGGITVAYDGLKLHHEANGRPGMIGGFTPEQRFFISWATIWRIKYRDAYLRNMLLTDSHSPGMYRANGPLSNYEPFFEAFDLKEGDAMVRSADERAKVW